MYGNQMGMVQGSMGMQPGNMGMVQGNMGMQQGNMGMQQGMMGMAPGMQQGARMPQNNMYVQQQMQQMQYQQVRLPVFTQNVVKFSILTGWFLIVLGFNNKSTLVGHFVSSPREREKRDRRDSRGNEREGQGERKMNDSEETEEIKTFPLYPYLLQGQWPCPTVSQYQLDAPVTQDTRHICLTQPPLLTGWS